MAKIDFIGQSATPRSMNVANLRCLNAYAEIVESRQGKSVVALYGAPGLRLRWVLPGAGAVRALYSLPSGRTFAVHGGALYELLFDPPPGEGIGQFTFMGSLLTTAGPVSIADNGRHLFLADGEHAYAFDLSTHVFTVLTSAGLVDSVAVIDGYAILNQRHTATFIISDLYSIDVDPADNASIEGRSDLLITLMARHGELWLFGSHSTEVWFNSGNIDFPFQRIHGAFLEVGCAARGSVAKMGEAIYWLGRDDLGQGVVWQAEGFTPRRISTHPVELAIRRIGTFRDALSFTEQRDGHYWYWLTFPSAKVTWVFDATTNLWHERGWLNPQTGTLEDHRASCLAYSAIETYCVGDRENGNIYISSLDHFDDAGAAMPCEFTLPPIYDPQGVNFVQHQHLCLDMETGVGLDGLARVGTDPQVMMQMSNDGGHTWGHEHWRRLGKIGQRRTSVEWRQLGAALDRRYKFRITDPVKRAFVGAYLEAVPLAR